MRSSIAPPGPELDFVTWTVAVAGYLRGLLDGVKAARRPKSVIMRYADRGVTIHDEGAIRRVVMTFETSSFGEAEAHELGTEIARFSSRH
jgi:hypothetical protein